MSDPSGKFRKPSDCEAYTVGQDKVCPRCEMVWSIDDTPPDCLTYYEANRLVLKRLRLSLTGGKS